MKWLFGIIGIGMATVGGFGLSTVGVGGSSFNYEEASIEDRQAWLEKQARPLERGVKRGMLRGSGAMYLKYKETKVLARSNEIQTIIKLSSMGQVRLPPNFKREMLASFCPDYMRSALYTNRVKITIKIVKKNGSPVLSFSMSAYDCNRFTQANSS